MSSSLCPHARDTRNGERCKECEEFKQMLLDFATTRAADTLRGTAAEQDDTEAFVRAVFAKVLKRFPQPNVDNVSPTDPQ
jgi:hypothetical protein